MQPTLFTKIINGDIPSHKIYEDEKVYAFLDIHPYQPGHTLVVPKNSVEFIWDLSAEDYQAVMAAVQLLGRHIRATMGKQYVGVKVVGVDVPHAHVHVYPFDTPAEYNAARDLSAEPDHTALTAVAKKLSL